MIAQRLTNFTAAFILAFGSLLVFAVPTVSAAADTCTWTGGAANNNFSDAANWAGCDNGTVPESGDALVFPYGTAVADADKAVVNDLTAGTSFTTITISGTLGTGETGFYTITGNAIAVTSGLTQTGGGYSTVGVAIAFTSDSTINIAQYQSMTLGGVVSGSGNLTKTGLGFLQLNAANTFTGTLNVTAGTLDATTATSLGTTAGGTTVASGADINVGDCGDTSVTIAENFTLTGISSDAVGDDYQRPKIEVGAGCGGIGGSVDEAYASYSTEDQSYTFTGAIVLGSDVVFGGFAKTTKLTGALSGNFKFLFHDGKWSGQLLIESSANTSNIANGVYNPKGITQTLTDDVSAASVYIGKNAVITINGKRGSTIVADGGVLKGTGTVADLSIGVDGTLAPGASPGCINSGDLSFVAGATYQFEVGGVTACTEYDQTIVTGTVNLGNGTLSLVRFNDFKPAANQNYTIISNDAADNVTGTFAGLGEGATFTVDGYVFRISYVGGDGNDVVVTVQSVPSVPATGIQFIKSNPLVSFLATSGLAAGLWIVSRKQTRSTNR